MRRPREILSVKQTETARTETHPGLAMFHTTANRPIKQLGHEEKSK